MDAQNAAATVDQQQPSQSMAERFEQWMVKFERVYKDAEEKQHRFNIFAETAERVDAFNASGEHSYTKGLNQFSDLTHEEFSQQYFFIIEDDDEDEEEEMRKQADGVAGDDVKESSNVDVSEIEELSDLG